MIFITFLMSLIISQTPQISQDAPIPFRCDSLSMNGKQYSVSCKNNVIIRYDTLLLCCDNFFGQADKKWQWKQFTCRGNVRSYMDGRWIWGSNADYNVLTKIMNVYGKPILKQGHSWFKGEKVKVFVEKEKVVMKNPKGLLIRQELEKPTNVISYETLPEQCPLPDQPNITEIKK